jgi:FkbM family methyltransferase
MRNLLPLIKWILFNTVCLRKPGVFLAIRAFGIRAFAVLGLYERENIRFLQRIVRPGSMAIDVGANCGVYALALSQCVGKSGMVWAFEPVGSTFEVLERETAKKGNVHCEQIALSNECRDNVPMAVPLVLGQIPEPALASLGEPIVHYYSPIGRWMDRHLNLEEGKVDRILVTTKTLDSFCHQLWDVSFIKVDVEGNEMDCLEGARAVLAKFRPVVQFESHDRDLSAFESYARDLGFKLGVLSEQGKLKEVDDAVLSDKAAVNFYLVPDGRGDDLFESGSGT